MNRCFSTFIYYKQGCSVFPCNAESLLPPLPLPPPTPASRFGLPHHPFPSLQTPTPLLPLPLLISGG